VSGERWPSIPVAGWQDTRDTLHLYTQVVGKVRRRSSIELRQPVKDLRDHVDGGPGAVHAPRAFEAVREFAEQ
jgi:hypothetical protein